MPADTPCLCLRHRVCRPAPVAKRRMPPTVEEPTRPTKRQAALLTVEEQARPTKQRVFVAEETEPEVDPSASEDGSDEESSEPDETNKRYEEYSNDSALSDDDESDWEDEDLLPHGLSIKALDALQEKFASSPLDAHEAADSDGEYTSHGSANEESDSDDEDSDANNQATSSKDNTHSDPIRPPNTQDTYTPRFQAIIHDIITSLKKVGNPKEYKEFFKIPNNQRPIAVSAYIFMMRFSIDTLTKRFLEFVPPSTQYACGNPLFNVTNLNDIQRIHKDDEDLGVYLNIARGRQQKKYATQRTLWL
ncbi:hypothetical protein B0T16DRAFT_388553 [Cercophora newfieldiana]|uniref:Uncharacterized protein n=1 Tax=Cercophora newfieldiana TaxID=92897 RepID=A0AA40CR95_9PEZI|nr:hypothetical protein B0T16DRAFT_388553 [Cercophora newfieldiana]